MKQHLDNKTKNTTVQSAKSTQASSTEKSKYGEPDRSYSTTHLISRVAAADGGVEPPSERISTLINSPAFSPPANSSLRNQTLLQMQQDYGNDYVRRMVEDSGTPIQTSLKISRPGDVFEQEADRVSEQVMRTPAPETEESTTVRNHPPDTCIQRNCRDPECKEEEEETLQAKETPGQTPKATPNVAADINALRGRGRPMPDSVRNYFEPRFGQDFSNVHIHTDSKGADTARAVNAQAFTVGRDVVFGTGYYAPKTEKGQKLLAHELTHVVQQTNSGKSSGGQLRVQRKEEGTATVLQESSTQNIKASAVSKNTSPEVYWSVDFKKLITYVIPRTPISLQEMAKYLCGDPSAAAGLATINNIDPSAQLAAGFRLQITGVKDLRFTKTAFAHFHAAPKVPIEVDPGKWLAHMGVSSPDEFIARKKQLDNQFKNDFTLIVRLVDVIHSLSNFGGSAGSLEGQVISILRRWGEEKLTTNPSFYKNGGDYLDKLFRKLSGKAKDVGTLTTQLSNYYSLIFNHFNRVKEVEEIRDKYSRLYRKDRGFKEMSFGSFFWDEVKEGRIRDQIFAFGKGLAKGAWAGLKGVGEFAYTLATDPGKAWEDFKNIPGALKTMWEKRGELWKQFANASPEEQAEMIGKLFGQIEFAIASGAAGGAAAQGVSKLAQTSGKVGQVATVVDKVIKVRSAALVTVAKGVKTMVWKGVPFAAKGAMFAAKGVFKLLGKVLRGTWSVVEKIAEKGKTKLYYFYDETKKAMHKVSETIARLYCRCSDCKLTPEGKGQLKGDAPQPKKPSDLPPPKLSEVDIGLLVKKWFPGDNWEKHPLFLKGNRVNKSGGRNPLGSTEPEWYSPKKGIAVEVKRKDFIFSKSNVDWKKITLQLEQRILSMPRGTKNWLAFDLRRQVTANIDEFAKGVAGMLSSKWDKVIFLTDDGAYILVGGKVKPFP